MSTADFNMLCQRFVVAIEQRQGGFWETARLSTKCHSSRGSTRTAPANVVRQADSPVELPGIKPICATPLTLRRLETMVMTGCLALAELALDQDFDTRDTQVLDAEAARRFT